MQKVISINGESYRVPVSVIQQLKVVLEDNQLDQEYEEISHYMDMAERNVKNRNKLKWFISRIPLYLFPPLTINSKRWDNEEVELEYKRLMKEQGAKG